MIYDYSIILLDTLLNTTKPFNKYEKSVCAMAGIRQKNIWSFNLLLSLKQMSQTFLPISLKIGPYEIAFCWYDLVITGNFSNPAAQFLPVGTCAVSASASLQLYSLYILFSRWLKCP